MDSTDPGRALVPQGHVDVALVWLAVEVVVMPRRHPVGSESRLSREGLRGAVLGGKRVRAVYAHQTGKTRTFYFTDGTKKRVSKDVAIGVFLEHKYGGVE